MDRSSGLIGGGITPFSKEPYVTLSRHTALPRNLDLFFPLARLLYHRYPSLSSLPQNLYNSSPRCFTTRHNFSLRSLCLHHNLISLRSNLRHNFISLRSNLVLQNLFIPNPVEPSDYLEPTCPRMEVPNHSFIDKVALAID